MDFYHGNNLSKIFAIIGLVSFIYIFIAYLIEFLLDIVILSVVGYLFSRLVRMKLKYKSIFSISIYSLTLPITLYLIYLVINIFTGFTIRYFEIAYNGISYIYIITAILMIKSELTKQQIEVGKIVKEQEKIREEKEQEEKEKTNDKEKKENKDNKEKKNKKGKKKENLEDNKKAPEGNEA